MESVTCMPQCALMALTEERRMDLTICSESLPTTPSGKLLHAE